MHVRVAGGLVRNYESNGYCGLAQCLAGFLLSSIHGLPMQERELMDCTDKSLLALASHEAGHLLCCGF